MATRSQPKLLHPGEEPGPALRQAWDRRAWADARPDKVVPTSGDDLRHRWIEELNELGYVAPARGAPLDTLRAGAVDRDGVVELLSSGLAHVARRGTRPTPGVRSSGSLRPAEAWLTGPCVVSWQRI